MKKLNKANLMLAILFSVISVLLTIIKHDYVLLLYIIMIWLPFILKIKPVLTLIYLLFSFIAMFLGNMLHLYRLISWYDSLSHFLWGIISSLLAIYILDKLNMWNKNNILFNIVFIFIFSIATAGLWEIIEFAYDSIFGGDMQRIATGVYDTMKDIIVSLFGNILFILWFFYEYYYDKKMLIHIFVENMINN